MLDAACLSQAGMLDAGCVGIGYWVLGFGYFNYQLSIFNYQFIPAFCFPALINT
jgi:hypothetical protein